jgi:hypothetical protein
MKCADSLQSNRWPSLRELHLNCCHLTISPIVMPILNSYCIQVFDLNYANFHEFTALGLISPGNPGLEVNLRTVWT